MNDTLRNVLAVVCGVVLSQLRLLYPIIKC